jgi:hypothetical protein
VPAVVVGGQVLSICQAQATGSAKWMFQLQSRRRRSHVHGDHFRARFAPAGDSTPAKTLIMDRMPLNDDKSFQTTATGENITPGIRQSGWPDGADPGRDTPETADL